MPTLPCKHFYAIADRHRGECYGPVLDTAAGSPSIAYHRVDATRESLVVQSQPHTPAVPAIDATYIYSPVFVGGRLVWSQQDGTAWPIVAADENGKPYRPFAMEGRARSLATQAWGGGYALVWEERAGKRTRIRGVGVSTVGTFGQPFDITDGVHTGTCACARTVRS